MFIYTCHAGYLSSSVCPTIHDIDCSFWGAHRWEAAQLLQQWPADSIQHLEAHTMLFFCGGGSTLALSQSSEQLGIGIYNHEVGQCTQKKGLMHLQVADSTCNV